MNTEKNCGNCKHFGSMTSVCYKDFDEPVVTLSTNLCPSWKEACLKETFESKVTRMLGDVKLVLVEKNKRYGNSALEPIGVFSKQDSTNSICIRIDDKIGRIKNSTELRKNDVFDLIGYLVLLCISKGWTSFKELID